MGGNISEKVSCFSCEIRIVEAKNIEFKSPNNLFVRYYLSAGNNKRIIGLDTKKITSKSDFIWNQCFSLECLGTEDSIKQASVMFELRRRKTVPFLGRIISASQLLGRAVIPWDQVFESQNVGIDKWVSLVCEGRCSSLNQQPKLKLGMRVVRVLNNNDDEMEKKKRNRCAKGNDESCACKSVIGHCEDHDVFAIAAPMEFF